MSTPNHSPVFLSPGFIHAAEIDARGRAERAANDPDQGWTIVAGKRIPYRRHFHRGVDRRPPFYARALRSGREETADGWTEAGAIANLRARLGLAPVSSDPTPPAQAVGR